MGTTGGWNIVAKHSPAEAVLVLALRGNGVAGRFTPSTEKPNALAIGYFPKPPAPGGSADFQLMGFKNAGKGRVGVGTALMDELKRRVLSYCREQGAIEVKIWLGPGDCRRVPSNLIFYLHRDFVVSDDGGWVGGVRVVVLGSGAWSINLNF